MDTLALAAYGKDAFSGSAGIERDALCAKLAENLSSHLSVASNFHDGVRSVVAALRVNGHDLWSYDEDEDFEVWGPNYAQPSGPGIVVTFRADHSVEVTWSGSP